MLVVDNRSATAVTPGERPSVPVLRVTDPARYARACRARALVLDREGHHEEAQQLRALADTKEEIRT